MKKSKTFFLLFLLIAFLCLYLLVTASPALVYPLGKNDTIPLGSFITWVGLIALPLILFWGSRKFRKPKRTVYRILSVCLKSLIVLSLLWLPIAYGLAGNMNFNFGVSDTFQGGQEAMRIFWILSLGLPLATFILFLIHAFLLLFNRKSIP